MSSWYPTSSIQTLKFRAALLSKARDFFRERDILEVETPVLGRHAVTEPNIQSLKTMVDGQACYLQSSPEYFMKRLLAAGAPDIYQISKVFRAGESGDNHNPEFTLIEWYRHQYHLQQMMAETAAFIGRLLSIRCDEGQIEYVSYFDVMQRVLGQDLKTYSSSKLVEICKQHGLQNTATLSHDQLYDFIFSSLVMPALNSDQLTVIYHFPASQASLAQLSALDASLADRFEVFYQGKELANGFVELTDANEQLERFRRDQQLRSQTGLENIAIDKKFIAALSDGLPPCAGVAVGMDRIVMLATQSKSISEVISFDWAAI